MTSTFRTQLAGRIDAVNVTVRRSISRRRSCRRRTIRTARRARSISRRRASPSARIQDLPFNMAASATLQRIERAPRAIELFSKGPHDATQTFDIGNPNLTIEAAKTAEIGLKRVLGDFRFDGKAYYTRYDNFIYQQPTGKFCDDEFATCGTTGTGSSSKPRSPSAMRSSAARSLPGSGTSCRWGRACSASTANTTRSCDLHGRQQRATDAAAAARWRRLLAQRQLVRAHGAPARVGADTTSPRSRRRPPATICSRRRSSTNASGNTRRGDRSKSRPGSPATTCSTSICATARNFTRTKSCCRAQLQVLPQRQVRRRAAKRPARLQQGAQRRRRSLKNNLVYKAPVIAAWNWGGFYVGGNAGWSSRPGHYDLAISTTRRWPRCSGPKLPDRLDGGDLRRAGGLQLAVEFPAGRHRRRHPVLAPAHGRDGRSAPATSATRRSPRSTRR